MSPGILDRVACGAALAAALCCVAWAAEPETELPGPYLTENTTRFASAMETAIRLRTEHPERVSMETLARTRGGLEVRIAIVTTVPPDEQPSAPATLVVAGIKPSDSAGVQVAMELLARLAREDSELVTDLLARRVFYIVPVLNPDLESARAPYGPQGIQNGRPDDQDQDRRQDEDGAHDIDGDGQVLQMRIPDPAGEWTVAPDPRNPEDRRLLRQVDRQKGEVGEFRLEVEGQDQDSDGARCEDGPGSVDLSTQFPAFWEPRASMPGAGMSPLWEPEARGLVDFLLDHRNVGTAYVLAGSGGEVLMPLAARDSTEVPEEDRVLLEAHAEDLREAAELNLVKFASESEQRRGTLLDWLYWEYGALPLEVTPWSVPARDLQAIDEEWKSEHPEDDEGEEPEDETEGTDDSSTDPAHERAWLRWCTKHVNGGGFRDWQPHDHPELGRISIGGWLPVGRIRPPSRLLPALGQRVAHGLLSNCDRAPQVVFDVQVRRADQKVNGVWEILARVGNAGSMPTATARARTTRRTPRIALTLEVDAGEPGYLLGFPRQWGGHLAPGQWGKECRWLVEVPQGTQIWIKAHSTRGGGARKRLVPLRKGDR